MVNIFHRNPYVNMKVPNQIPGQGSGQSSEQPTLPQQPSAQQRLKHPQPAPK
ncbi:MAG: hypothetical protein FWF24_05605 [Alphaproteobacteria bacterium]|nr:hypothetical protein [Alphaproteobacteria bacterium]